mgnify:CR=1 FL=1
MQTSDMTFTEKTFYISAAEDFATGQYGSALRGRADALHKVESAYRKGWADAEVGQHVWQC